MITYKETKSIAKREPSVSSLKHTNVLSVTVIIVSMTLLVLYFMFNLN